MFDATSKSISKYFHGSSTYVVPFFQRSYVWTKENWQELWDAIKELYERDNNKESTDDLNGHFIGTVIVKHTHNPQVGAGENYELIDGQQRLTTISILYKAFATYCNPEDGALREKTEENLFFRNDDGETVCRIEHSKSDRAHYERIIRNDNNTESADPEHKLTQCYTFFTDRIQELNLSDLDKKKKLKAVLTQQLQTISMVLNHDDDEQKIFDTINSLGMSLTVADLVKNYVFSRQRGLTEEDYESLWRNVYEEDEDAIKFWNAEITSGRIRRTRIEILLYCFLIISKKSDAIKIENLFREYKTWIKDMEPENLTGHMEALKEYAKIYRDFPLGDQLINIDPHEHEKRLFRITEHLSVTTPYPFILYFYHRQQDSGKRTQFTRILASYLMRRYICKLSSKNYNQMFIGIINRMEKDKNVSVIEAIKEYKDDTSKFPTNEEVEQNFHIQHFSNKVAHEILFSISLQTIQRHNMSLRGDAQINLIEIGSSVEHVMPKKWEQHWNSPPLNDEEAMDRNSKLLTIGNLMLITKSLNSTLKNKPWSEKKGTLKKHTLVDINHKYLGEPIWNEEAIEKRAEELHQYAQEAWPSLDSLENS